MLVGATASAMTLALQVETEKSGIPLVTNSYADGIVTRGYKYTFKITPQGGGIWNWSMTSAYDLWKASKGGPPKSALIFMSNDAVGFVVQNSSPSTPRHSISTCRSHNRSRWASRIRRSRLRRCCSTSLI